MNFKTWLGLGLAGLTALACGTSEASEKTLEQQVQQPVITHVQKGGGHHTDEITPQIVLLVDDFDTYHDWNWSIDSLMIPRWASGNPDTTIYVAYTTHNDVPDSINGEPYSFGPSVAILDGPNSGLNPNSPLYDPVFAYDVSIFHGSTVWFNVPLDSTTTPQERYDYMEAIIDSMRLTDTAPRHTSPTTEYSISPCYPNPTNGTKVNFEFTQPHQGTVFADVYNILGQKVTSIEYQPPPGTSILSIPLNNLSSGRYFANVNFDNSKQSRTFPFTLLK